MAEKTKIWYLQNFNLIKGMDESSMDMMDQKSKMKKSSKREIIYFPEERSDNIYMLKEGKVKISRVSEDGKKMTLHLIGPGEIFGESAILGQDKRENIAEVVEDAVICSINRTMFQEMLTNNPKLNLSINKFIGVRIRKIQAHVEDLVFKDAKERVVAFLKRYAKTFGKEMIDGWMVRPFLTHQEIADLTATSRQTVNSILNDLVSNQDIKYTRRYFQVLRKDWIK
ncbi:MAG: Crp/Fnr family transcriptional regulator [Candidatus Marinimicrobia bacterium]|nr:Crp/Fnr family transcriptional regulator [Candidatus Neomarinimicrobiota bacterium]